MAKSMTKSRRTKSSSRKMRKSVRHHKKARKSASRKSRKSKKSRRSHKRSRGRRMSSRRHRRMRGGAGCATAAASNTAGPAGSFSIVPSTLTDMGRSMQYGTMGAYAAANGNEGPVNPLPYKDQLGNGELPDDVMLLA